MVKYPFELWLLEVSESEKDELGFEKQGIETWLKHSVCYEQVNGSSGAIRLENGEAFVYSSKIFLPANTGKVNAGTKIQVRTNDGEIRFTGECARFSTDVKHCRIWA